MALKWGIYGSGNICTSFVNALQASPNDEHKVIAVAARKEENARRFADKYSIGKAYGGGYQQLATDPDVGKYIWGRKAACRILLRAIRNFERDDYGNWMM